MPYEIPASFVIKPQADPGCTVKGEKYRITVLTSRLLRLEYSQDGVFEDRATRFAFNRQFEKPRFRVSDDNGRIRIVTDGLRLDYDGEPFSNAGLSVHITESREWRWGDNCATLPGTVRTLDGVNGACPLGPSVISRKKGFAVYDDSNTMVLCEDGSLLPVNRETDVYLFAYGNDYESAVRDLYRLTGNVPLFPRYALGNWWSRYHDYTEQEYIELLDDFEKRDIPLSVAVIDMDWHITKTPDEKKYGAGWTGYTWNKDLFPDYRRFLRRVHEKGLRTSLNLHPHSGIRAFEEQYPAICEKLGREADGSTVEFDVSDRKFMEAYFETVLRPYENDGVDFWWIDWQQSGGTKKPGYDPLLLLNHTHYTDNCRGGRRGLLFSRYAGIGSHRYPIGFSGDTHVTWESLDFQPYFTACAANIGYCWWSHDIGGHMSGIHDSELYTRWIQLGVFSPINRLHSTANPFIYKEPWKFGETVEKIVTGYLQLRHRLVPYLYSEALKCSIGGIPPIRPLYHVYPYNGEAYDRKNEYFFGSELICAPVTEKSDPASTYGKVRVWIPGDGVYCDLMTGRSYRGGRTLTMYRSTDIFPLLAKAGAIIPLDAEVRTDIGSLPEKIELHAVNGSGSYELLEDSGGNESCNEISSTRFTLENGTLKIGAAQAKPFVPGMREYTVVLYMIRKPDSVTVDGRNIGFSYDEGRHICRTEPFSVRGDAGCTVVFTGDMTVPEKNIEKDISRVLFAAQGVSNNLLRALYNVAVSDIPDAEKVTRIKDSEVDPAVAGALTELIIM